MVGGLPAVTLVVNPAAHCTEPWILGSLLDTCVMPEMHKNTVVPTLEASEPKSVPMTPATAVGVRSSKLPPWRVILATSARIRPP